MQIKKYIAPTLKEALESMKEELGDEAIVLSTRILEANSKLNHEKMFELTAGLEFETPKSSKEIVEKKLSFEEELQSISQKMEKKETIPVEKKRDVRLEAYDKGKISERSKDLFAKIKELLEERDVDKETVERITGQLNKYSAFINEDNYEEHLISVLSAMIPTSGFELSKKGVPKIICLAGPTGVGKTTCIAKLAVISKILHNLEIGLISLDTYRLGAIDQLKIFSDISNIDLMVAYEPADLVQMIEKFKKKDIIFIDTAGRSQNNKTLLDDIKKFLAVTRIDEMYLVLNSSSSSKTLIDVAQKFKILNYNGIILTKLDEAVSYGSLLNLVEKIQVPIKYLTNGQVIPDDILAADPEFIAHLILTGKISQ